MKNLLNTLAALSIAAMTFGCSNPQKIMLDKTAPDAICEVGDTVQIALKENPTTGYSWTICSDYSPVLKLANRRYQQFENPQNMTGVGGTAIYTFTVEKSGTATIDFELKRAWEKSAIGRNTFTVTAQ